VPATCKVTALVDLLASAVIVDPSGVAGTTEILPNEGVAKILRPNPKGRRKYQSSPELVSGPWLTRVVILMNMSTKAFYVETGISGGLAWPQLMCCALDLLSADACKSCWW
jgi:hypothetical protein